MQISLRDMMDAMMGVATDSFTLAAQVVYKALEQDIDMLIDWAMVAYNCSKCTSWQRTCRRR